MYGNAGGQTQADDILYHDPTKVSSKGTCVSLAEDTTYLRNTNCLKVKTKRKETIINLKQRLEEEKGNLPHLYEQKMEFSRFHNGLVWQVSSIFIPFSFSGLALNFTDGSIQLSYVGWGSIIVLMLWTCLAEWHRWMWVHSFHCVKTIEAIWKYSDVPQPPSFFDLSPPSFAGIKTGPVDLGRLIRLSFALIGIYFWLSRLGYAP
jgi:hypothetical protein